MTQLGHSVHNSQEMLLLPQILFDFNFMFGVFERARACAVKGFTDFRNVNY